MNPEEPKAFKRIRVEVTGTVQGVGFRPFVYRLAQTHGLTGWVRNTPAGVTIEVQGGDDALAALLVGLERDAPPLAAVSSVASELVASNEQESCFEILASGDGEPRTEVPPDGDVCDDCLRELFDPADRRYRYPFITCTNCGPRYSIITGIPYDRPLTTMAGFPLCVACRAEYDNPADRRFHAQPLACPECGPRLTLLDASGKAIAGDPLAETIRLLCQGAIVALKGVGGFHLAVDASSPSAVQTLRSRKRREDKPFALMFPDLQSVSSAAYSDPLEERLLAGPERPIVLLRKRDTGVGSRTSKVAPEVAPGSSYLGVMLPSTPLHHLILRDFGNPLVMTSGNRSGEPIAFRDEDALQALSGIADAFLCHDRSIRTRLDDSVIRVFRGNPLFLRRSRGYAPRVVQLVQEQPALLAVGAELKGACCFTRGDQAFMSQHIGDMENLETVESLAATVEHLSRLLKIEPQAVAHDLHPDYLSTRFAMQTGLPAVTVQHHHAHLASCMAENRLNGPVIGVIFDGTGYGTDGTIWGGEFLVGDYGGFRRAAHFRQVPLPGGDAAVREPYRMALSWCHAALGDAAFDRESIPLTDRSEQERLLLRQMLERGLNSPMTSSCGRLFDAVSALLGLRGIVSYEGQAAIELEAVAESGRTSRGYPVGIAERMGFHEIDFAPLFIALLDDIRDGASVPDMARSFHSALASASLDVCRRIRDAEGLGRVVLSGGVFQNRLLTEELWGLLTDADFQVYTHRLVPPNDGGLALGQAMIAARRVSCV